MEHLRKGRKRSVDSTLLGIKTAVLEFEHRFARRQPTHADILELTGKIKAAYFHGSKLVAQIYIQAMEELDNKIQRMKSEMEAQDAIRKERKEQGITKWN